MAFTYDNQDWARVNNGVVELKNADGSWTVSGTPEHAESLGYMTTAANSPEVDKLIAYARSGGTLNPEQQAFLANPLLGMDSYGQGSRWGGALDLFDNQFSPQQAGALSTSGLSSYLTPGQLASGQQFVQQESPAAQSARDDSGDFFSDILPLLAVGAGMYFGLPALMGTGGASAASAGALAEGFGGAGMLGDAAMWGLGDAAAGAGALSSVSDFSNLGDLWNYGSSAAEGAADFSNLGDLWNYGSSAAESVASNPWTDVARQFVDSTNFNPYTPDFGTLTDAQRAIEVGAGQGIPSGFGMEASGSIPGMDTLGSTNWLSSAANIVKTGLEFDPLGMVKSVVAPSGGSGGSGEFSLNRAIPGALSLVMQQYYRNKAIEDANKSREQQAANYASGTQRSPSYLAGLNPRGLGVGQSRLSSITRMAKGGPIEGDCGCDMSEAMYASGGTPGQADKVPAMLSDGEFVFDADTVAALGDGNNAAGASVLEQMRQNIRKHKRSAPASKIPPKAKRPEQYLKGAK